jgi:hypothetical protein
LTLVAAALICIALTIGQPLQPLVRVQAQSGVQTATLSVTDGYDTKLGKRLSQDGKVYTVQSSDDERWETDAEHFTAFQFTSPLPAGVVIQSVRVMIEHHEENDFGNGALRWEVGIGDLRNPIALIGQSPPILRGKGAEARVEWNVTPFLSTAALVNDLKFVARNNDPRGKKTKTDHLFVVVTYTSVPTPTATTTPTNTPTVTPTATATVSLTSTPESTPMPTSTPAALSSISLAPSPHTMAVGATQLFTATGKDAAGNTIQDLFVSWSVSPGLGGIESTGPFTALVRAGDAPGVYPGAVVAAVGSIAGAADVELGPRPTQFTPSKLYAPVIANEATPDLDNHTACTAYPITPPVSVTQAADDPFNIYRFAAASQYQVTITGYASTGKLALYRIVDDRCATAGTISVNLVQESTITSPTFQTTLDGMVPGESYLLVVNMTGALTSQAYIIAVAPLSP